MTDKFIGYDKFIYIYLPTSTGLFLFFYGFVLIKLSITDVCEFDGSNVSYFGIITALIDMLCGTMLYFSGFIDICYTINKMNNNMLELGMEFGFRTWHIYTFWGKIAFCYGMIIGIFYLFVECKMPMYYMMFVNNLIINTIFGYCYLAYVTYYAIKKCSPKFYECTVLT